MTTPRAALERAGLDVDALIGRLTTAAAAELGAYYRYTILAVYAAGFAEEGLREILKDIRDETRHHFQALVTRVHELGGVLPEDVRHLAGRYGEPAPDILTGGDDLGEALVASLRDAVSEYRVLRDSAAGKDHRTHALAQAVHQEKTEHIAWLREFSGSGPPPRHHRGFRGRSPALTHWHDDQGRA